MAEQNQYQTPSSNVEQTATNEEYGAVNWRSIEGRLGRIRYIAYSFVLGIAGMAILGVLFAIFGIIMAVIGGDSAEPGIGMVILGIIMAIAYIILIVLSIRLMIQRLHDFNASGWLCLIIIIPFVSSIFALVLLFVPGTNGENQYGLKTPPNSTANIVVALVIPIVMIVFMGIVAAIAIPAYQGYVEQAQQMQLEQSR